MQQLSTWCNQEVSKFLLKYLFVLHLNLTAKPIRGSHPVQRYTAPGASILQNTLPKCLVSYAGQTPYAIRAELPSFQPVFHLDEEGKASDK